LRCRQHRSSASFQAFGALGLAQFSPTLVNLMGTGIVEPSLFRDGFE